MGNSRKNEHEKALPQRWALILLTASAVGIAVGLLGGVVEGVGAGFAALAVLNEVIS